MIYSQKIEKTSIQKSHDRSNFFWTKLYRVQAKSIFELGQILQNTKQFPSCRSYPLSEGIPPMHLQNHDFHHVFFKFKKVFILKIQFSGVNSHFHLGQFSLCVTSRQCALCSRSFGTNSTTLWNQLIINNMKVDSHQKCVQAQGKSIPNCFCTS